MSSVMKGCEVHSGGSGGGAVVGGCSGEIVRSGYLKKLKTSRRKFFVLRAETAEASAKLEYYDSERKFNSGLPPKRSIPLKNCFNINKRSDIKQHKHVIALYTKDDCFCVVLDNEEEVDSWLKSLLSLQHGEEAVDGEPPKPTFEHIWQVTVLNRGLGTTGLTGTYRLCLTDKTLSLIKKDSEVPQIELNLPNIRSCGNLRDFFFLEIGRSSTLGPGELWMQTEDNNIAQNIHSTVFHAMSTNNIKEELGPKSRNRSSSATESSKPNTMNRKQIHTGVSPKCIISQGLTGGRERCDSMPSRARTTSEGGNHSVHQFRTFLNPYRPSSIHGRDISHSPPSDSPVSPPSAGCSTDSGSSYSLAEDADILCPEMDSALGRYSHSLTPDEAIAEEDCPDSPTGTFYNQDYLPMQPPSSDDGYVEMVVTTSVSSITSGTPSTDIRFGEYHLDNVPALVAASEDSCSDDSSRPMRAYSLGARPDCPKQYAPAASINNENLRVRALSVGSKTKKHPGRVLPPHHSYQPSHVGTKSSSAPILSNSRHNSDDFAVMDFSRNSSNSSSRYMSMKPGGTTTSSSVSGSKHSGGYMHMLPGNISPYVEMTPGASPAKSTSFLNCENKENNTDYMVMGPGKNNINNNNNNSNVSDYLDMTFKSGRNSSERTPSNSYQLSPVKTSCCIASSPSNSFDMYFGSPKSLETIAATTPEGYVEMSVGKGHHQRQSSFEYSEETGSGRSKKKKSKEKCTTTRSQPITIQLPTSRNSQKMSSTAVTSSNSSSSPIYGIGRKFSTGTPPKMHLPLNSNDCHNSLPRQNRSRKNSSRRDSRDSSSSSITTPSSSSTIFPMSLNSPCSPPNSTAAATVPVTIKVPPAVLNTVYKKPPSRTNNQNKCEFYQFSDYTPMDFDCGKSAKNQANNFEHSTAVTTSTATTSSSSSSDYVNFYPGEGVVVGGGGITASGDYALMGFGVGGPNNQIASLTLNDSSSFRPISEDVQSESPYELLRTRPTSRGGGGGGSATIGSRPSSTSSELCSSSGSTIIVGMLSRPESVNSDRIRPLSNNSSLEQQQQLHYASLDLDNDVASSRSPRTVKNSSAVAGGTSNGGSSSGNNSSNSNENSQSGIENSLQYAAIDFVKSEGLKNHANSSSNSSSGSNAKLKH